MIRARNLLIIMYVARLAISAGLLTRPLLEGNAIGALLLFVLGYTLDFGLLFLMLQGFRWARITALIVVGGTGILVTVLRLFFIGLAILLLMFAPEESSDAIDSIIASIPLLIVGVNLLITAGYLLWSEELNRYFEYKK